MKNRVELLERRRLLSAGDLDPSFGTAGIAALPDLDVGTSPVFEQSDNGKFYIAGQTTIARLNSDFTLDTSFGSGGTAPLATIEQVDTLLPLSDGGVLVAGHTLEHDEDMPKQTNYYAYVIRLTSEGDPDTTFSADGVAGLAEAFGDLNPQLIRNPLIVQLLAASGGKFVLLTDNGEIARLTADGAADTTFAGDGVHEMVFPPEGSGQTLFRPFSIALDNTGMLLAGGDTVDFDTVDSFTLARFDDAGQLDPNFGSNGFVIEADAGDGSRIVVLSNGDMLVAGFKNGLSRFNADGSLDTTFGDAGVAVPVHGFTDSRSLFLKVLIAPGGGDILLSLRGPYGMDQLQRFSADGVFDEAFGRVLTNASITGFDSQNRLLGFRAEDVRAFLTTNDPGLGPVSLPDVNGRVAVDCTDGNDRVTFRQNGGFVSVYREDGGRVLPRGQLTSLSIDFEGGNDLLRLISANSQLPMSIIGGAGDDTIVTAAGLDTIDGGEGNDLLSGGAGDDLIIGGAGNDSLHAGDGDNILFGGDGDDYLKSGPGRDSLWGEAGNDELRAGFGNDFLHGGAGKDKLFGQQGNDRLFGSKSPDAMDGGPGSDLLDGFIGDDKLFDRDEAADTLQGGDGTDIARADDALDDLLDIEMVLT